MVLSSSVTTFGSASFLFGKSLMCVFRSYAEQYMTQTGSYMSLLLCKVWFSSSDTELLAD